MVTRSQLDRQKKHITEEIMHAMHLVLLHEVNDNINKRNRVVESIVLACDKKYDAKHTYNLSNAIYEHENPELLMNVIRELIKDR